MSLSMPTVTDHAVHLFLPFYFPADSDRAVTSCLLAPLRALTIADLAARMTTPDPAGASARAKGRDKLVWGNRGSKLSLDFHPQIGRILDGPSERSELPSGKDLYFGTPPLTISPEAVNLLSGGWGRRGKGLELHLSVAANRRLGTSERQRLPCRVDAGHLFLFGTGVGLLVLDILFHGADGQPSMLALQEGLYALSHYRADSEPRFSWAGDEGGGVVLAEMVGALLAGLIDGTGGEVFAEKPRWMRLFSYIAVSLSGNGVDHETIRTYTYRLSKKYSDDYQPEREAITAGVYCPFDNIFHGLALEGGALVAVQSADGANVASSHVATFIKNSGQSAYLPIAIIAYQEYLYLIRKAQGIHILDRFGDPSQETLGKLGEHQYDLLNFRINFRFSHLSLIGMHNAVYARWREALSLDAILSEVTADVREADAYLTQRQNDMELRYRQRVGKLQTTLGVFYGSLILMCSIFGMNFVELGGTGSLSLANPSPFAWVILIAFVIGSFGFAVYYARYYDWAPKGLARPASDKEADHVQGD